MLNLETLQESIPARIKHYRKLSGKTQKEISKISGIGLRTYEGIEAGSRFPSVQNLCLIANALKVRVSTILNESCLQLNTPLETALNLSFFSELKDVVPVGIHDGKGLILEANPPCCKLLGMKREELFGKKISDIVTQDSALIFESQLEHERKCLADPYTLVLTNNNRVIRIYPTPCFANGAFLGAIVLIASADQTLDDLCAGLKS